MIGLYGVGSTLAGSDSLHYFWGMLKVQVYSVKARNTDHLRQSTACFGPDRNAVLTTVLQGAWKEQITEYH